MILTIIIIVLIILIIILIILIIVLIILITIISIVLSLSSPSYISDTPQLCPSQSTLSSIQFFESIYRESWFLCICRLYSCRKYGQ